MLASFCPVSSGWSISDFSAHGSHNAPHGTGFQYLPAGFWMDGA
jgi:hypothetical protein